MRVGRAQRGESASVWTRARALRRMSATRAADIGRMPDSEQAEARLAVRSAAALYIVGALLTTTTLWLPHVSSAAGVTAIAVTAIASASVLLFAAGRWRDGLRAAWIADLWGVLLVALLCAATEGSRSPFAMIYFFAAGHAAAFQSRGRLFAVWAASVVGFLAPLLYGHISSEFGAIAAVGMVLALITAAVIHFALNRAREQRRLLELLISASSQLDRSLDPAATVRRIADSAVPGLADLCVVDLLEPGATVCSTAAACSQTHIAAQIERIRRQSPLDPRGANVVARTLETREAQIVNDIEHPAAAAHFDADDDYRRLLAAAGCHSALFPMAARGRVHGAISFLQSARRGRYRRYQLAILADFARHAGVALDNARLYAERARVASTLRRSLTPAALPAIPGLELASFFRPMMAGDEVGGDFFDVFRHHDGCWLAVGDVCGKGAEAAALTGFLRHTTMAYARESTSPAEVLLEVNQAMLEQDFGGRFATLLLGRLQPAETSLELVIASGGHPPALILRAGGDSEQVGECGTLLGVFADPTIEDTAVPAHSGDVLLLYTDGLPDAHAPGRSVSVQDMLQALELHTPGSSQAAIDVLLGLVDPHETARDDIAILAARVKPLAAHERYRPSAPARRHGTQQERALAGAPPTSRAIS